MMLFQLPSSPLLSQEREVDPKLYCDSGEYSLPVKDCGKDYCECIHLLKVDVGDIVEVLEKFDSINIIGC